MPDDLNNLKFMDSFAHYGNNNILAKWTTVDNAFVGTQFGRGGSGAFLGTLSKTLSPSATITTGFAYKINTSSSGFFGNPYIISAVNVQRTLSQCFQLQVFPDGTFGTYAGNNVLIANNDKFVCTSGVWMYIEININFSTGLSGNLAVAAELKINGETISNGQATSGLGVSFLLSQLAEADYHTFGAAHSTTGQTTIADLYIQYSNNFQGDIATGFIVPRSDVNVDFLPSSGSERWPMVSEAPPDDDASYVYDGNVGGLATFLFSEVSSLVGQIQGVQMCVYARKDSEGSRVIVDTSGTYTGPLKNQFFLGDNYYYHTFPYDVDPSSGNPFTPDIINATAFGVKIVPSP